MTLLSNVDSVGGRPSLYRREYATIAQVLRARGYSYSRIATVLRVSKSTVCNWAILYQEFATALGREEDLMEPHIAAASGVEEKGVSGPCKVEGNSNGGFWVTPASEQASVKPEQPVRWTRRLEGGRGRSFERPKSPPRRAIL